MTDTQEDLLSKVESIAWVDSVCQDELIKYLSIFDFKSVLRFLSLDKLRSIGQCTKEKAKAKSASKEELLDILSAYDRKSVLQSLKSEDLSELTRNVIESYLGKLKLAEKIQKTEVKVLDEENNKFEIQEQKSEVRAYEMASKDDAKVSVFDGRNYSTWKERI